MSEITRRQTNRDRVLAYLQQVGRAYNHELVAIGGLRAMGRVHELQRQYHIDVRHEQGGRWVVTYYGPRAWSQPELFGG